MDPSVEGPSGTLNPGLVVSRLRPDCFQMKVIPLALGSMSPNLSASIGTAPDVSDLALTFGLPFPLNFLGEGIGFSSGG